MQAASYRDQREMAYASSKASAREMEIKGPKEKENGDMRGRWRYATSKARLKSQQNEIEMPTYRRSTCDIEMRRG